MCGIFFIYYNDAASKNKYFNNIKNAYQLSERRGPDNGYLEHAKKFSLAFRRLCINDTSILGNQPMVSDKTIMMCNGEIYNYKDLVNKYDLQCESNSDCEVFLRMYDKNLISIDTMREFDGDFATIIYDKELEQILLTRDRIGVRPLFYGYTKELDLVVASEIKCMDMCTVINHVLPGTMIMFKSLDGKMTGIRHQYYKLPTVTISKPIHPLKNILTEAVRKRLLSDRPVGCLLSGGLDSSIITSILCKLIGYQNVRTYSIGMEGSLDLKYAREVSEYLHTTHTEVKFTADEGVKAIQEVIFALESYDITTVRASVGMYLLAKYIAKNSTDKVIFSGEGSDELLCGYLYFHHAPTGAIAHTESLRLVSDLYKYDVLRSDRCISSHGLELRVPFLDKDVVEFCVTTHGHLKKPHDGIEKGLLRELFRGELPDNVLYRRKDGFSDGVSAKSKSWYEYIREFVESQIPDAEFSALGASSISKEAYFYKKIYNYYYPYFPTPIDYYWMPKWVSLEDPSNPSGRVLDVFNTQVHYPVE